ncbi:MAG TPA: hypothetical protein VFG53_11540 [Anaeromyxobacter sp.]|nr:hypothetical protein [Anaeromyxobacter sp.]
MSEGEHTIIGKIPRERLNQIASRKLSAMGVPVRLGADRETLEGELSFGGRLVHPATGQPIAKARFVVDGHDRLRFPDPPLSTLGQVNFYEHERAASLEQALGLALARRGAALQEVALRMRAFGLEGGIDAERLAARAVLKTATHAFEVLGTPEGVRISRVAPVGGKPFEVATDFPPLDLTKFASVTELEIYLVGAVPRMPGPALEPAVLTGASGELKATAPPRNAVTLALLTQVFGEDTILAPNAPAELVREFEWGHTRYRFVATRELGTRFRGRLIGPAGDMWSDHFELESFPGTEQVVALALGGPAAGGQVSGQRAVPGQFLPRVGEVWVMNVVVEEASADEVRYVGTDIDGHPYGAARVLKRADFEAVFAQDKGDFRLLVHIDQLQEGNIIYRQLDRQRQPIGAPRKMAASILVANFVPEATSS